MTQFDFTRRSLLKGAAAGAFGLASSCCPARLASHARARLSGSSMSARATISAGTRRMPWPRGLKGVPGVTVVEEENVPETDAVSKSMKSMINLDGGTCSSRRRSATTTVRAGHGEEIPDGPVPPRRPACGDNNPKNAGSYFCYLDQAHYVDGVAAGLSPRPTSRLRRSQADRDRAAQYQLGPAGRPQS